MIHVTQTEFETYCPSAINPEGYGIFEMIQGALTSAEVRAWCMLDAATQLELDRFGDKYPAIVSNMKRFISLEAYDTSMPHLDLVLTPTGFGVVSNQNVAPASSERVNRLREQVRESRDDALDALISSLRSIESWAESEYARKYIPTLIWNSQMLVGAGITNPHRTKLVERTPLIASADRALRNVVGNAMVDRMLDCERRNTPFDDLALYYSRMYMCELLRDSGGRFQDSAKRQLIEYLESHIDSFPEYACSSAYRATHSPRYENKKDDSCYFF